jgi:hypothetical protein
LLKALRRVERSLFGDRWPGHDVATTPAGIGRGEFMAADRADDHKFEVNVHALLKES